jgi:hypothetical protein
MKSRGCRPEAQGVKEVETDPLFNLDGGGPGWAGYFWVRGSGFGEEIGHRAAERVNKKALGRW